MSASKRGPRSSVNLLRQDVEEVAEAIKFQLILQEETMSVYVEPDGSVVMERAGASRRKLQMPDHWLLGVYTHKVRLPELEDDIVEHCRQGMDLRLRRKVVHGWFGTGSVRP